MLAVCDTLSMWHLSFTIPSCRTVAIRCPVYYFAIYSETLIDSKIVNGASYSYRSAAIQYLELLITEHVNYADICRALGRLISKCWPNIYVLVLGPLVTYPDTLVSIKMCHYNN